MALPAIETVGLYSTLFVGAMSIPVPGARGGRIGRLAAWIGGEAGRWQFIISKVQPLDEQLADEMRVVARDSRWDTDAALRALGGPPALGCGCPIYGAEKIGAADAGTERYPPGLTARAGQLAWAQALFDAVAAIEADLGCEASIWWHECPRRRNTIIRCGPARGNADGFDTADGYLVR